MEKVDQKGKSALDYAQGNSEVLDLIKPPAPTPTPAPAPAPAPAPNQVVSGSSEDQKRISNAKPKRVLPPPTKADTNYNR